MSGIQEKMNNNNLDEFFAGTLTKLNKNNYNELNLIIGNESCDLDSAVSALVYANFLNWQYNQIKCKVCTKPNREDDVVFKDDIFVPIMNIDRNDYELKTEVAYYLRERGIYESNLLFRDDHDLRQLISKSKTKVTLVDHHILSNRNKFLAPFVTEIIDHRPLDKDGWCYRDDTRSTIETVGSCCTLIAQRIKDLSTLVARDVDFFNIYPICSEMLHATIVLDTVNFSKEVDKATSHDEEIILFLETLLKPADYTNLRQRELDSLLKARGNVSHLSAAQLLKKDTKIVGDILVPSFPILVKEFLQRPLALHAVADALIQNNCQMALLLGMDLNDGLRRDTGIYSPNKPDRAKAVGKFLEDYTNPVLGLTQEVLSNASDCMYYSQLNLSASRKQYIPALTAHTFHK